MTSNPVGGSIQLALRAGSGLREGDSVVLHVIKPLADGKWAVGIGGRVYPASAQITLQPGQTLRARVGFSAGTLTLTVSDLVQDAVTSALQRQGIPGGGIDEIVARALARGGLPIRDETIQKVKSLLARFPSLDPRKGARAAATLLDKGFDPAGPAADRLLPVLCFGQRGGGDRRRYRGRKLPETPRAVKEHVESLAVAPSSGSSTLQAYNHTRGGSQSWVVIPFLFESGDRRLAGTMKILYDPFHSRPLAFSMDTEGVGFHLPLEGKAQKLSIYCDDEALRRAAARGLDSLRAKLHNMGLEVDDTIKEGNAFDGFTPIEEGAILPRVDTVG